MPVSHTVCLRSPRRNPINIDGDWTFGRDVMLFSDARLEDQGEPSYVPNGEYVGPQGVEPDDWV